ncbi:MAG: HEAT repeat domain-containing protein, partial [bacterium]
MKILVSNRSYLVFSGLLVLLVCLLLGCEGQSKEHGANGTKQEVKGVEVRVESKEQKVEDNEQPEIQVKEETAMSKPKLYERKIEKKVAKIVDTIEKYCIKFDRTSAGLIIDPELNKLIKIGTASTLILIEVVKDRKRDWRLREIMSKFVGAEGGLNDNRIDGSVIEILKDKSENKILREEMAWTLGRTEGVAAADTLLEVLKIEEDVDVRVAIINALGEKGEGEQGDKRGVEPLIKILKDEN